MVTNRRYAIYDLVDRGWVTSDTPYEIVLYKDGKRTTKRLFTAKSNCPYLTWTRKRAQEIIDSTTEPDKYIIIPIEIEGVLMDEGIDKLKDLGSRVDLDVLTALSMMLTSLIEERKNG